MLSALLGFSLLITSTSIYIALALHDLEDQVKVAGYLAVFILLLYYAAPLSVLAKVQGSIEGAYYPLILKLFGLIALVHQLFLFLMNALMTHLSCRF